jgi:hypothetical protein
VLFVRGGKAPANPAEPLEEEVVKTGFCNEQWGIPRRGPDVAEQSGHVEYIVPSVRLSPEGRIS